MFLKKKEVQREEGVTLCCSRLHLSRTEAKLSLHRCAASSAATSRMDSMSDHCMPSLLTQPYAIAIHTTTNQTLVLLVVQGGGSLWSFPRLWGEAIFPSWSSSFSNSQVKYFWPVAATSRWWSLEQFPFQINIWNATISSFWKVLLLWAFQSSLPSTHLGKVPQRGLFLSEFPPNHPSLYFSLKYFPLPYLERF